MPSAFDDILALVRSDRLLRDPRATGAGVRVAVLDSGVDRAALKTKHRLQSGSIEGGLFRGDRPEPAPDVGQPSAPHGTTVADIILTIAPEVRLYSADVFGSTGACDVETVIRALRYVVDAWGAKVVNLSLGVPEARLQAAPRRQAFLRAIEDAYFRDVLVFAAAHNEHPFTRSYPAVFAPPLVSVDKGPFAEPLEFAYRLRDQIEFQAFGRGYLGPFAREPATSWATPHLAGIAARLLSLRPNLKLFEFKTLLYWMTQMPEPPMNADKPE
jgi:subtilisin family serine protease